MLEDGFIEEVIDTPVSHCCAYLLADNGMPPICSNCGEYCEVVFE